METLLSEVRDFVERLGRVVETPREGRLVAKHRTALVEEETQFAVLDSPQTRPLKRAINILAKDHPGLLSSDYPHTFRWNEFLDWTVNAKALVQGVLDDPGVCAKAASFIPQNLEQDGVRLDTTALQFFHQTWLPKQDKRLLAVLAPAGYGKTVLTCALARRMAKIYLASSGVDRPAFPYLINFGEFRRLASFESMILTSLQAKGVTDYTASAFAYLVQNQRIVLVLDGFDELLEERPEEAQKNLRELIETLEGRGKVIVTARSTFFRTSDDVADFLAYYLEPGQVSVVDLLPFDRRQRRELVANRTKTGTEQNRVMSFIESDGLQEAMGSPLLLNETVEALLSDDASRLDRAKGRRDLFDALEQSVYARERVRKNHRFRDDVQRRFLKDLARELLEHNSRGFDFEEVQVAALEAIGEDTPDASELDRLAHHHFLAVASQSREVRFNHQVFREYFQARAFLDASLGSPDAWVLSMLSVRPLPQEVRTFAAELDKERALPNQLIRLATQSKRPNQRLVNNVASVCAAYADPRLMSELLERVPVDLGVELSVAGLDLSHVVWSGRYFNSLQISDCTLDGGDFSGSAINELGLSQTSLVGAKFLDSTVESLTVDFGKRIFGTANALQALSELGAECGLEGGSPPPELVEDRRSELLEIIRSRLNRFYLAGPAGVEGSRWDSSIQERNLLGGVKPVHLKFVKSQVVPAMVREGVLQRRRQHGLVIYDLTNAAEDDARAFIEREEVIGSVAAVVTRLES